MDFPHCWRQSTPQAQAVAAEGDACPPSARKNIVVALKVLALSGADTPFCSH